MRPFIVLLLIAWQAFSGPLLALGPLGVDITSHDGQTWSRLDWEGRLRSALCGGHQSGGRPEPVAGSRGSRWTDWSDPLAGLKPACRHTDLQRREFRSAW